MSSFKEKETASVSMVTAILIACLSLQEAEVHYKRASVRFNTLFCRPEGGSVSHYSVI